MDKAIEKQKEFIRQQASSAYMASVDPETRGQMAADIFRQHRQAGLAPPTEAEVNRMVIQGGREMRVGVRGERERLTDMQQRRQQAQESLNEESAQRQQAEEDRRQRRGAIVGAGRGALGIGMKGLAIGAAVIGAGGLVGMLVQGVRWANEFNNIVGRLEVGSDKVAGNIGKWAAGTAMSRLEASRYAERGMRAFGRGGMNFMPGLEYGAGYQEGELLKYAPMFRMGGMESREAVNAMLVRAYRASQMVGRPLGRFGLMAGTAMATDVLGRSLVTPSAPGTLASISALQQAFGEKGEFSEERATRVAMQMHGAMTSPDEIRRSFMLRALGFEGGGLEDYQKTVMQLEKGIGDPTNVRAMLARAKKETGGRGGMVQLLSGMGLSMTYASKLADKYLGGEVLTDEKIRALSGDPTQAELDKAEAEKRKPTTVDRAIQAYKDAVQTTGGLALRTFAPALNLAAKGMGKLEIAIIKLEAAIRKWMGEDKGMPSSRDVQTFEGETLMDKETEQIKQEAEYAKRTGRKEGTGFWSWLRRGKDPSVLRAKIAEREDIEKMIKSGTLSKMGGRGLLYDPSGKRGEEISAAAWKQMGEMSEPTTGKHQVFYRNSGNTFVIQATETSLANALEIFKEVTAKGSTGGIDIDSEERMKHGIRMLKQPETSLK